jgi:hypothetical protein
VSCIGGKVACLAQELIDGAIAQHGAATAQREEMPRCGIGGEVEPE